MALVVAASIYNSFYFSSEPLLMTAEHVEPWPFQADTAQIMCCYSGQVTIFLPGSGQNYSFQGGVGLTASQSRGSAKSG